MPKVSQMSGIITYHCTYERPRQVRERHFLWHKCTFCYVPSKTHKLLSIVVKHFHLEKQILSTFGTITIETTDEKSSFADRLDRFRVYLEDEGGDVTSIEPTLAKYHALMYVSNPNRNADFQHMFDEGTSKKWVAGIKKSITDVLESVLENVPLPRLLQMYESFMTSYKGFDEQLKNQQEMALDMQRIASVCFNCLLRLHATQVQ